MNIGYETSVKLSQEKSLVFYKHACIVVEEIVYMWLALKSLIKLENVVL